MRKALSAAALVLVGACGPQEPAYRAPAAAPTPVYGPVPAATLSVTNDMFLDRVDVYLDGRHECALEVGRMCTIHSVRPGRHELRVVQEDGTFWHSPYDYSDGELVRCVAHDADVDCTSHVDDDLEDLF